MSTLNSGSAGNSLCRLLGILTVLLLSACAATDDTTDVPARADLIPATWSDLPGWKHDNVAEMRPALERSCAVMNRRSPTAKIGPSGLAGIAGKWQRACQIVLSTDPDQPDDFRKALEAVFNPYSVQDETGSRDGLFTGYYEASLEGSRTRSSLYHTPLYQRPGDLVMVQLGDFRDDLKGRRIAGRIINGQLKPYEDRGEIVAGQSASELEPLVYVADPVEAFFLQIQGSGRILLDDGDEMRVGYAAQNGHPYVAIGRTLIDQGELTRENVSLQSIRDWLKRNPDRADEIMNSNPSYVFFREIEGEGPIGGEGVALTAGRSLAIDRSLLPYGVPVFLDADDPMQPGKRLQRLMMAQDTGGAIRGAVRGDVFWGYGSDAEERAGNMKSSGRYWLLLPKVALPVPVSSNSSPGHNIAIAQEPEQRQQWQTTD